MIESGSEENATSENPLIPPSEPVTSEEDETPEGDVTPGSVPTNRAKSTVRFIVAILIVILGLGGYLLFSQSKNNDEAKIQGKVALSAEELRDVVAAKKLTVYWAGPQTGAKYTLIATTPGIAYVRYLPGGVGLDDTKTLFRAIGTYVQKNAFDVSLTAGKADGNVGFTNSDGNAVFYSKARPSNVYIGIKGKDIQVEVFDPVVDQALGLVLVRGQISLVN